MLTNGLPATPTVGATVFHGGDALQAMGARLVAAAAAWRAAECGGWHPAHGAAATDGASAWF